jgi:signal transduction histidine kinase
MQQVLLNLIMNAIEAMATVTAQPRLLAVTTRGDASAVELSVKDCGIGLDKGVLERIFEPFYSDKPEGMGMGLAISRAIINEHGGRLWVTRNKVAGAKFHFRLPVAGVDPT